ncbi:hypothetical protein O6H91_04G146200 [Diphasiastrum complanatum]|uniref:Uncharacterized protein n=2 Tax=Diphasiastrum complanatum TaxID=34168 RepID=A0ACC2E3B3_DIPCM|nr:hypothetical protein O6H91_04G146200 [Diphasiastrum complanatum]KAJ7560793.1 hypothetical protein O6H91_04G146200 [Diphasiastrum complanatum]
MAAAAPLHHAVPQTAATNATCIKPMTATSNGAWQGDNPIDYALPLLVIQIVFVLILTRTLAFLMKPLRQPRVIAEIIGGILLGPSALGRDHAYLNKIFPTQSLTVLDTFANMGLLFFLFLVGLELDLKALRRTGREALIIAGAGISVPFIAGIGVSFVLRDTISKGAKFAPFLVFMGVAMSITAFPVLARILAERKLLTTDVGQTAMSAAAVNDVVAWILLALAVALSGSHKSPAIAAYVLLCGLAYVVVMFLVVKPIMTRIANRSPDKEPVKEIYVTITLAGVLVAGFVTDSIGIHGIFGAFVFGLIIPKDGPFAGILIEKLEDFVTILMLPLYFASSGLKTNVGAIHGARSGGLLALVITTACVGKIFGTLLAGMAHGLQARKALTLGFLMNTKGLVELIVLNIGKERKVLNDETFAIMVLMALFTTFMTTPIVMALYKPARNRVPYTRRKVDIDKPKDELRILACVHGMKNVPAIINLVETTRGTRKQALRLYILHLVELSERSSAIMMVHRVRKDGRPFWNHGVGDGDNIVVAFEAYGQLSKVMVRPMTAISGFEDMHDDICNTAAEKRAAIIILPHHKYQRFDGVLETMNPGFRAVNQRVLQHAPCSVGILVDRGLGGFVQLAPSTVDHNISVFFTGGPDDREALVLGCRMAEHPGIKLTVIRFVKKQDGPEAADSSAVGASDYVRNNSIQKVTANPDTFHFAILGLDSERESKLDEEYLATVNTKQSSADASPSISFEEIPVHDPIEAAIGIAVKHRYDLILVGRARRPSPLIVSMVRLPAESSELGPVGDALTALGTEIRASILVIQQHDPHLVPDSSSAKISTLVSSDETNGTLPV